MTTSIPVGAHPGNAGSQLPRAKQTTLGLYVTAAQAYEMWKASPHEVKVIDVPTPEEFAFVGPGDGLEHTHRLRDLREEGRQLRVRAADERGFRRPGPGNRSADRCAVGHVPLGGRGALAVNQLAAAGFTKAYNIVDGVEGDVVEDPDSVFNGKHTKNGWKNSAPWVYDIDPEKVILEEGTSRRRSDRRTAGLEQATEPRHR